MELKKIWVPEQYSFGGGGRAEFPATLLSTHTFLSFILHPGREMWADLWDIISKHDMALEMF